MTADTYPCPERYSNLLSQCPCDPRP